MVTCTPPRLLQQANLHPEAELSTGARGVTLTLGVTQALPVMPGPQPRCCVLQRSLHSTGNSQPKQRLTRHGCVDHGPVHNEGR